MNLVILRRQLGLQLVNRVLRSVFIRFHIQFHIRQIPDQVIIFLSHPHDFLLSITDPRFELSHDDISPHVLILSHGQLERSHLFGRLCRLSRESGLSLFEGGVDVLVFDSQTGYLSFEFFAGERPVLVESGSFFVVVFVLDREL